MDEKNLNQNGFEPNENQTGSPNGQQGSNKVRRAAAGYFRIKMFPTSKRKQLRKTVFSIKIQQKSRVKNRRSLPQTSRVGTVPVPTAQTGSPLTTASTAIRPIRPNRDMQVQTNSRRKTDRERRINRTKAINGIMRITTRKNRNSPRRKTKRIKDSKYSRLSCAQFSARG